MINVSPLPYLFGTKGRFYMENKKYDFDTGRDAFFFEDDCIVEMYFNSNSSAGRSIVENHIRFAQFLVAAQIGYDDNIWSTLEGGCTQYIHDIDNEVFPYYLDIFQKKESACGTTEDTFHLILDYIYNKLCVPKFIMKPDGIWEYIFDKETGTATRCKHELTDVAANKFSETSDQFFEKLHGIGKREQSKIGEYGFDDFLLGSDRFSQKGYTKETMCTLVTYADTELLHRTAEYQTTSLHEVITRMDEAVSHAMLDAMKLRHLYNALRGENKGCCYCTPSDIGYCVDTFSDPETKMEVQLCIGEGSVEINVKFADGREGRLATTARYCPYCGKKIR